MYPTSTLIKGSLILCMGLLFANFSMAKNIMAPPAAAALFIQTVNLSNEVQIQYRYVNGSLKYIVLKNTGKPMIVEILEEKKVIGTAETYVMKPPRGVSQIRINLQTYSTQPDADIFNWSKDLLKQTYLLFLP